MIIDFTVSISLAVAAWRRWRSVELRLRNVSKTAVRGGALTVFVSVARLVPDRVVRGVTLRLQRASWTDAALAPGWRDAILRHQLLGETG